MAIDLSTAKERLANARADVEFYGNLVKLLSDSRLKESEPNLYLRPSAPIEAEPVALIPMKRSPRGEVRRKVHGVLPAKGSEGTSTSRILETLADSGYAFISKHPLMAINDALVELQADDMAFLTKRVGVTNYWTKGDKS